MLAPVTNEVVINLKRHIGRQGGKESFISYTHGRLKNEDSGFVEIETQVIKQDSKDLMSQEFLDLLLSDPSRAKAKIETIMKWHWTLASCLRETAYDLNTSEKAREEDVAASVADLMNALKHKP